MTIKNFGKAVAVATLVTVGLTGVASACCKTKFERTKPHVNVGTIGQVGQHKRCAASPHYKCQFEIRNIKPTSSGTSAGQTLNRVKLYNYYRNPSSGSGGNW